MDNGNHSCEQGESESDVLEKSKTQHRERAPRESHSCMDPRRLAIVRARDALRKRRWREKRKLELSQKIVNEEEQSQQNECESSKFRIELETVEVIPKTENDFLDALPEKHSSKRAGISPEKLREMRAKDAERKRKARMRKRLISAGVSDGESMSLLIGQNDLLQSEVLQKERIQKEELEQIGEIALAQLSIDVNDGNGEPSTASDSGLSSIFSPSSAFSPVSVNHTPKGCSRIPRKLLTPNQLLEVRSKDNARKREQRSRKKMEQQQDMAKNILQIMNGANEALATPTFNALAVNSIFKMNPQCVLNPLLGSGGLGGCLPPSIPTFPLISGSSLLCTPGLPFSTTLNVDTDLAISTSAPASLLESYNDQDPMELFRSLVEKVSQRQFSPRVQSEERAAAKRAARAARIARMTEQQKDVLRASDRERKRLWRQRRRELQGGSSLSESAHPSSSSNQ